MIPLKSPDQIDALAAAGRVLDTIIEDVILREVRPGRTTGEVAQRAHEMILARKGEPVLRGYQQAGIPVPFPASACVCVNEEVVHAVPSARIIRPGDIVTVDVAMRYRGWCIDTAWSVAVPGAQAAGALGRAARLQAAAAKAVAKTRELARPGVRWSSIAAQVQQAVAAEGMHLLHGYCGHGVGEALHEAPRVSYTSRDWTKPDEDFTLWPGMVLCIEPIVCEGLENARTMTLDDHWTVITADARWTAHEEQCIAVTREGCRVLAGSAQY
jgi:methionyl aminopeptidase